MALLRARAWRACLTGGLLCVAAAAHGQIAQPPSGELTLARAIAAALAGNPALRVSEFELLASEGRLQQAGLRPNPELGVDLENFAGSGDRSGTDALETTLALSQVIELGGKRERRRDVARSGHELAQVERRIHQLDILTEVTQRYLQVVLAQERLALSETALDLAEQTHSVTVRRVQAARSPPAERSRAAIARSRARLAHTRAEQGLSGARLQVAATWGEDRARFARAVGELYELPAVLPIESVVSRLIRSPHLLRYAAARRLREAELQLALARARPSLKLTAGVRRLEEGDDTALVAGVSIPLPLFDRRQGRRAEARVRIAQTEADRTAALVEARATITALHGELRVARDEVEALRGELVPQAKRALAQTRAGFERGRFSYLELASAQQDVLDTQRAAIEAAGTVHRLHTEIERLTGEPLVGAAP